jgi:signal transduction histidine kinase
MRDYVMRLLADQFSVLPVPNGLEALRAVHELLPELPDLVLSDVMMPQLDGFGLLAALRSDPRTQTIPVILVSARAGAEAAIDGIDAGADDYLIKPFAARELIARVRTHVELGRTRRGWAAELARTNTMLATTNAELARTNHELVRANQELSRSNAELEAFSYSVSHDLRSPLRAIDAFTQILIEDSDDMDAGRRSFLNKVKSSGQRMRAIIDDLLSLARVGKAELRREQIDLSAIAHRIVRDLRQRDPARLVEVDVSDGMVTRADGRLVAIALENLLSNAWKFTCKRSPARIAMHCEDGSVFAVRDNGAGFDMTQSAQMFEPFQRLHASDEFEGTGIGLSIVRRIVERHGGQVWAHGETGQGATVRFTLAAASSQRNCA